MAEPEPATQSVCTQPENWFSLGTKHEHARYSCMTNNHDRAPLVLECDNYATWLDSTATATALFTAPKKLPLHVELAMV